MNTTHVIAGAIYYTTVLGEKSNEKTVWQNYFSICQYFIVKINKSEVSQIVQNHSSNLAHIYIGLSWMCCSWWNHESQHTCFQPSINFVWQSKFSAYYDQLFWISERIHKSQIINISHFLKNRIKMSENIKIVTSDSVKINISNTQTDNITFEKKFDKKLTIFELKVIITIQIF